MKTHEASGVVLYAQYGNATTPLSAIGDTLSVPGVDVLTGNTVPAGALFVGAYSEIAVDVIVTLVSGTSFALKVDRLLPDGATNGSNLFNATVNATGTTATSIGSGQATAKSFGQWLRVRWDTLVGSPTFYMTIAITGKG